MRSHTARRAFFWFFVAIFFVASPLLFFYASGFRYGDKKIVETGTLVLSTEPSGAVITLNGEPTGLTTPSTVQGLPPDRYEVSFTLPNYHPWIKQLELEAGGATFGSAVRLFRQTLPTINAPIPFAAAVINHAQDQLALIGQDQQLYLYSDRDTSESSAVIQIGDANQRAQDELTISWSPDDRFILLGHDNGELSLVNVDEHAIATITLPHAGPWRFTWDNRGSQFYAIHEKGVELFNAETKERRTLLDNAERAIVDAFTYAGTRAFIAAGDQEHCWELRRVDDLQAEDSVPLGCGAPFYRIAASERSLAVGNDAGALKVFIPASLLDRWPRRLLHEAENINEIDIDNSSGDVLYTTANGRELYAVSVINESSELLLRSGEPLRRPLWLGDVNHALFVRANAFSVIERDGRNGRSQWALAQFNSLSEVVLAGEHAVYLLGALGQTTGLYRQEF